MSIVLKNQTELDEDSSADLSLVSISPPDVENIIGYKYLKSMFPDVSDQRIHSVLDECDGINRCVDQLLNELAIAEELSTTIPLIKELENTELGLRDLKESIIKKRNSNSIELFKTCMKIDSSRTARTILSRYNNDLWESIFDVIRENEKLNNHLDDSISVQQNREILIREKIFNRDARYYSFDNELYLMMMNYFKNDITSVIYLTEVLLVENEFRDSRVKSMNFLDDTEPHSMLKKKNERTVEIEVGFQLVSKNKSKEKVNDSAKDISWSGEDKPRRQNSIRSEVNFDFVKDAINLDLHGFTKEDALRFAEIVTQKWWDTEIENRIIVGTISLNSKRIHCVQPLRIITGRGIHSSNGWSILKTGIRKHLERLKFIYEEALGSFLLNGKRC